MRFEWPGIIVVQSAEDEAEARELVDDALHTINKNPDGPRIYLGDGPPTVEED